MTFFVICWPFWIRMTFKWRNDVRMTGMKTLHPSTIPFEMTLKWLNFVILASFRHSRMRMNEMSLTTFLLGKFEQISATDCPPGTEITSAEECRDAGVYLRKQWLHQWGKTLTHFWLQQTKLTNVRLLSRWPYKIGFQYASNTPPCPLRKMFLHGMETWT